MRLAPPGQEGWLRHQEKAAIASLTPQTGWWFKHREKDPQSDGQERQPQTGFEVVEQPPRLRQLGMLRDFFLIWRSHPSWPGGARPPV